MKILYVFFILCFLAGCSSNVKMGKMPEKKMVIENKQPVINRNDRRAENRYEPDTAEVMPKESEEK